MPNPNTPNSHGRAFESVVVQHILNAGATAGGKTKEFQARDTQHVVDLSASVRTKFYRAAPKVVAWVQSQLGDLRSTEIKRLGDEADDVADFVLVRSGAFVLRVSLKHNHDALKHPRPYSIAQACGITKESPSDRAHRAALVVAVEPIRAVARRTRIYLFAAHPKETQLCYDQVVRVCAISLNSWLSGSDRSDDLFQFLVGSDFFKVILRSDAAGTIEVQDFRKIATPCSAVATPRGAYLDVKFGNGWHVALRIHNASSRIPTSEQAQVSLKFDAQRIQGKVSRVEL